MVLDGQGADELFAGYEVFRAARLADLLAGGRMLGAGSFLAALPRGGARRDTLMLAGSYMLPAVLQGALRRAVGQPLVPTEVDANWLVRHSIDPVALAPATITRPYLEGALSSAQAETSLPMLLRYADRNAMAVSVENRTPYLSPILRAAAASLPIELLVAPDGTCKAGLRAALRGLVPDAVLDRRDKIGFETPERTWFAEVPALRTLLGQLAAAPPPPCFTAAHGARLAAIAAGRAPLDGTAWRSLNLSHWATLFDVDLPA